MTVISLHERYPNIAALLAAIAQRLQMFLGHKSIFTLSAFISGIGFAEQFYAIQKPMVALDTFETWVSASHNPQQLALDSFGLAAHWSETAEDGFDLWFSWFNTFRTCHK
ncbi:MAG: hypothetical protein AAGM36_15145 [Cyanobacteria bacterium J06597_1]